MDAAELLRAMPFAVGAGIRLVSATPEEVVGRLDWAPDRCTTFGVLHGAVLITLADSLGAACAFLNLPAVAATSTIESKTNFFRAVRVGHVESTSRPLHVGRTTIVVQTDIRDGAGKRVAQVTPTQAVLAPRV